ncbi:hypothetical protein FACS189472_18830 [Alphaproteobacteria bacterium]|nr:hypothetical protein FACS189472_18830 [Alphaproteobacteria bacterium]
MTSATAAHFLYNTYTTKAFKDSVDAVYAREGVNAQAILSDLSSAAILIQMVSGDRKLQSEGVQMQPANRNPIKINVIDQTAQLQDQARLARAQAGRAGSRSDVTNAHFAGRRGAAPPVLPPQPRRVRTTRAFPPTIAEVENPDDESFLE